MDLLQTVRKEGSRGGRAAFSWDDVKGDQHRENYLGHSLMAPVGRWQQGRDLNWYAKGGEKDAAAEEQARRDEIRKVKDAEEEAMAKALGIDVGTARAGNPNAVELPPRADERERRPRHGDEGGRRRHRHHHRRSRSRSRERSPRRWRDGERSGRDDRYRERRRDDEDDRMRRREDDRRRRRDDSRTRDRPSRREDGASRR